MLKIVIASDSFKGSLSSAEVAEAITAAIHSELPDAEVISLQVADGGEGTSDILISQMRAVDVDTFGTGPLGDTVSACYGIVPETESDGSHTAILDMASVSGLDLVPYSMRNPLMASSLGTGELIADAYRRGCRRFIVGIGGSATCDCGMGMLDALGYYHYDVEGKYLRPSGDAMARVARIDSGAARRDITECRFTIVCDVDNPLYGPDGAAYVYAPQKGASPDDVEVLDRGLRHYSSILTQMCGRDVSGMEGAGAAGGLGAAFMALFNANLRRGVDVVLDAVGFDEAITGADLVITGEGKIDRQTLSGKLPMGVCSRAKAHGVPSVVVAGCVEDRETLEHAGFKRVVCIKPSTQSLREAMRPETAKSNLRRAILDLIKEGSISR